MPKHGKNGEPVYDSIDLATTYFETKKIFARMGLSVQDMTALIGAGHSSPNASLTGGEFYGQWVPLGTGKEMGMQYFQFLTAHGRGWCAVNAGGSALFVSGGPNLSQPADRFSPIGRAANCVESVENKSVYGSPDAKLPEVDPSKLTEGSFPGPSGAAAMLPTDFMLQYSPETYQHVEFWAGNGERFWAAFLEGWLKLTENGVQRLCPEINSTSATVADYCVTDPAAKANYFSIWGHIKDEVKRNLTQIPQSCRSVASTYCLPSVFRMGFHVSGTFDPNPVNGSTNYAFGLHGGSEGPCFLGLCSEYDGCGGCLSKTIQAVIELGESLQYKYPEVIVSVPDILILAASVAVELLTPQWRIHILRWRVPFRPGRKLYNISDLGVSKADTISACMEIGGRLPGPAYMGRPKASYTTTMEEEEVIGNMLSTDVLII
jgi:catalase (peroxidase I)